MTSGIEVKGLDELMRKLKAIQGAPLKAAVERAMVVAGRSEVESRIAKAPGPASHPVAWASDRQRKWWFASRRAAGLDPGYTRMSDPWSQNLEGSWTTKKADWGAIVGTKVGYAGHVQKEGQQTQQHKATGWVTDEKVAKEAERSGRIVRIVEAELEKLLRGMR